MTFIALMGPLTLLLLNTTCPVLANSVDPDHLASEEADWSGSALFVIKYVNVCQKPDQVIWLAGSLIYSAREGLNSNPTKAISPLKSSESSCLGPEVIKLFSCSTQLSMKCFMLINLKINNNCQFFFAKHSWAGKFLC